MNMPFEEPSLPPISPRAQRVLVAGWISLGLHAALIALVQVAPPAPVSLGEPVIEARLVSRQPAPVAAAGPATVEANPPDASPEAPAITPRLTPSEAADTLPVAPPAVAPPQPAAPAPAVPATMAESSAAAPPPASTAASAPEAVISSAVDLTYYSARDVDVQAKPRRDFDLKYPEVAERRRLSGKVRLKLKIEADGRVSDIELVSATHPDLYDAAKLKAILDMPFHPAQKNGRPVRELFQIEVEYDWEGRPRN